MGQNEGTHTFSLVTRDHPGVLVRIALVFARRGYNIESLAVSPGATGGFARMTIVTRGDSLNIGQMSKQLEKLVDVVFVTHHRGEQPVEAEVALFKLRCEGDARRRGLAAAQRHGARADEDGKERVILIMHGSSAALDALRADLPPENLEELVRSGKIVIDRGASRFAHVLGGRGR